MNSRALALVGVAAVCVALSGCDRVKGVLMENGSTGTSSPDQPSKADATPDPRNGEIDKLLATMSPEVRVEYDRLLPAQKAKLDEEINGIVSHPQGTEGLGRFLTENDKQLSAELKRAQDYEQHWATIQSKPDGAPGSSAADKRRMAGQFATILAELEARRASIAPALKRDPIVAQAYELWRGQKPQTQSIVDLTRLLIVEPCRRDWSSYATTDSFLNFRGIALGMTEGEAMKGVCAANQSSVSFAGRQEAQSHNYQANGGDSDGRFAAAAKRLSKPYTSSLTFCFDCLASAGRPASQPAVADSDLQAAHLLPDGRIYKVDRSQPFLDKSTPRIEPAPRKLSLLLPPLEKKFGPPSYIFDDSTALVVAWVYPDRRSPLPLERWYFSPGIGNGRYLQFKSQNLIYERGEISKKLLARQKPVASYCATHHGAALTIETQTPMHLLISPNPGKDGVVSAGNCGVIVTAKFYKASGANSVKMNFTNSPTPVDNNMNVYSVEMSMIDTSALESRKSFEMKQIGDAASVAAAAVENRAANPQGPAFRP